ncbi:hypothetical protein [Streptomyces sp. NPDC003374]
MSPFAVLVLAADGWLPAETAPVLAVVAVLTVPMLLSAMCEERPPPRSGRLLLTARTLTGERTVDLSAISTVRLLTYFSRSGVAERVLLVRDHNGVRLGLKSQAGLDALRRALDRDRGRPRPRVSRSARVYLGMSTGRLPLVLHTVLGWLAVVYGACGYMLAVLALAGRITK